MPTKTGKNGTDQQPHTAVPSPLYLVDSREQLPLPLVGLPSWYGTPIEPSQVQRATLAIGDYSAEGWQDQICLERKSEADFYQSMTFGRKRLLAEVERAACLRYFAFIIEVPFREITRGNPRHSRFSGASAARSILSWSVRWPHCHWWFADGRLEAAGLVIRLIERFVDVQTKNTQKATTTPEVRISKAKEDATWPVSTQMI